MKKFAIILLTILCITALAAACLCACDNTPNPDGTTGNGGTSGNGGNNGGNSGNGGSSGGSTGGNSGNGSGTSNGDGNQKPEPAPNPDPEPAPTPVTYSLQVGAKTYQMLSSEATATVYSATVTLAVGDRVVISDSNGTTYSNYENGFDGVAKIASEYTFLLTLSGTTASIKVTVPAKPTPTPNPDPEPDPTPAPRPQITKTTVYYTDSERWGTVYAYVWNNESSTPKKAWPGEKLTSCGTSGYGEKQYSIEVDLTKYDRIIFNNGSGSQTKDLVVSAAVSGYYGTDGTFTMGTEDYGKVEYFTLQDNANLTYITNRTKKFSVYTPAGYSDAKKYGVLYMFDSQNLYIGAQGAEPSHDQYGSWAVDVAVTNLVKNGADGVIIVAIDNTDGHRDAELTMSQSFGTLTNLANEEAFKYGKLDELGNFIKQTLMPWVAKNYSVYTTREKTGIAGSPSGGLAAYYLGLRDNDLYGYVGAFSPANGLFDTASWNRFYSSKNFVQKRPLIYAYCGTNDGSLEDMLLPATKQIKNLANYGYAASEITENYVRGGTHSENYWRIAFQEFLGKMLG